MGDMITSLDELRKSEQGAAVSYQRWERAKIAADGTVRAMKEKEARMKASFVERVECSRGDTAAEVTEHLIAVQVAWQDWQDVVAEGVEQRKAARELVRAAKDHLDAVMANLTQMELPL